MGSISVSNDFSSFCSNLRLSNTVVSNIKTRYQTITKRINHMDEVLASIRVMWI